MHLSHPFARVRMLPDNSEQAFQGVLFLFNQLCPEAVLHSVLLGCFHKMQFKRVVTHQKPMSHTFSLWNFKVISVSSSFPLISDFKSSNCVLAYLGKARTLGNAEYQTPKIIPCSSLGCEGNQSGLQRPGSPGYLCSLPRVLCHASY